VNKTVFILLLGFAAGFWHKIWHPERDEFSYWRVTYVLFSTTGKRYVMNKWIILGFVPATVYAATGVYLISASPPLTKGFVRRETLNDLVLFYPFLHEDYQ